jgi:hypothetical protein
MRARYTAAPACPQTLARASRVKRVALAVVLVACSLTAGASVYAAGAAEARSPTCAKLRGKRLLSSHTIKLVEHAEEGRGTVLACAPPRGRVHTLGYATDASHGELYEVTLRGVAGTWLLLDFRNQTGPHDYEEIDKACDAASGRCYRAWVEAYPEPALEAEVPVMRLSPQRILINQFGQVAEALANYNETQIVAFGSGGALSVLDSGPLALIPSDSLQLEGHTVRWLHAGVPRSAAP